MDKCVKAPSKEVVREYLQRRVEEHTQLPSLQEIRRQLGWELVDAESGRIFKKWCRVQY